MQDLEIEELEDEIEKSKNWKTKTEESEDEIEESKDEN